MLPFVLKINKQKKNKIFFFSFFVLFLLLKKIFIIFKNWQELNVAKLSVNKQQQQQAVGSRTHCIIL